MEKIVLEVDYFTDSKSRKPEKSDIMDAGLLGITKFKKHIKSITSNMKKDGFTYSEIHFINKYNGSEKFLGSLDIKNKYKFMRGNGFSDVIDESIEYSGNNPKKTKEDLKGQKLVKISLDNTPSQEFNKFHQIVNALSYKYPNYIETTSDSATLVLKKDDWSDMKSELKSKRVIDIVAEGGLPQNWLVGRTSDMHTNLGLNPRHDNDKTNFDTKDSGHEDLEESTIQFTPKMLATLKKDYGKIQKVDPFIKGGAHEKIMKYLGGMPKDALQQIIDADIKWLSVMAKTKIKSAKNESVERFNEAIELNEKVKLDGPLYNMLKDMYDDNIQVRVLKSMKPGGLDKFIQHMQPVEKQKYAFVKINPIDDTEVRVRRGPNFEKLFKSNEITENSEMSSWTESEKASWEHQLSQGRGIGVRSKSSAKKDYPNFLKQGIVYYDSMSGSLKMKQKGDELLKKIGSSITESTSSDVSKLRKTIKGLASLMSRLETGSAKYRILQNKIDKLENDIVKLNGGTAKGINESNDDTYFDTYSGAVQHALKSAEKRGFIPDEDDVWKYISVGPKKPSEGKTNRIKPIALGKKNGTTTKKHLHIQVYGMKQNYELNYYIS